MIINLTYGENYRVIKGIKANNELLVYAIGHGNTSTEYNVSRHPVYFDEAPIALYIPMPPLSLTKDSLIGSDGTSSLRKIPAILVEESEITPNYHCCYFREDTFITKSLLKGFSIGVECLGELNPERNLCLFIIIKSSLYGEENDPIIVKDFLSKEIKGNFILKFFDAPIIFDKADVHIYSHSSNPIFISEVNLISQRIDKL